MKESLKITILCGYISALLYLKSIKENTTWFLKEVFPCLLLVYILTFFMMTTSLNHIYAGIDCFIRFEMKVPSHFRISQRNDQSLYFVGDFCKLSELRMKPGRRNIILELVYIVILVKTYSVM